MSWFGSGNLEIKIKLSGEQIQRLRDSLHVAIKAAEDCPRVLVRQTWPGMPKPAGPQNPYDIFYQPLLAAKKAVDEMTDKKVHTFQEDESEFRKLLTLFSVVSHDITKFNPEVWDKKETKEFRIAIRRSALVVKNIIRSMIDQEKGFLVALIGATHELDEGLKFE